MRLAKYSAKKVYLPNASRIGYGCLFAKPGHWVTWTDADNNRSVGRVLGRIDETTRGGLEDCRGYLAVMKLADNLHHAYVRWVKPEEVTECRDAPPRELLAWITGEDWARRGEDVARYIAMVEYGATSEEYIADRTKQDKPYNASPEYVAQFVLK